MYSNPNHSSTGSPLSVGHILQQSMKSVVAKRLGRDTIRVRHKSQMLVQTLSRQRLLYRKEDNDGAETSLSTQKEYDVMQPSSLAFDEVAMPVLCFPRQVFLPSSLGWFRLVV